MLIHEPYIQHKLFEMDTSVYKKAMVLVVELDVNILDNSLIKIFIKIKGEEDLGNVPINLRKARVKDKI